MKNKAKASIDATKTVLQIIEDTESALADAASESQAVGNVDAPEQDGALFDAMSVLDDVAGEVESILMRLSAARRGLEAAP